MDRTTLPPVEDDFMRALLRSAESDEPSSGAYTKVASALGAGVGLGVGASLPPAVAAASAGLSTLGRWSSSVAARLAAVGVSGVLVFGGVFLLRGRLNPSPAKPPAALGSRPLQPRPAVSGLAPLPLPLPLLAPSSAPSAVSAVSAPSAAADIVHRPKPSVMRRALRPSSAAERKPAGSSLAEQVQSLDRARVALSAGDSSGALREIAYYRATWPSGVFVTEASVLEIEALAARGERSLAAMRASALVAAHPDIPQAGRLRALIPREKR